MTPFAPAVPMETQATLAFGIGTFAVHIPVLNSAIYSSFSRLILKHRRYDVT